MSKYLLYIILFSLFGCNRYNPEKDVEGRWATQSVYYKNNEMLADVTKYGVIISGRKLIFYNDETVLLPVKDVDIFGNYHIDKEKKIISINSSPEEYFNQNFTYEMGLEEEDSMNKLKTYYLELISVDSTVYIYSERIVSRNEFY